MQLESNILREEIRKGFHLSFVVDDLVIDLQSDLNRVTNWVDVKNVKDDAYHRALRTSSRKVFWIRAEVPEMHDFLF